MLRATPVTLLQVSNPDKYNFKPKEMLAQVVGTMLHLAPFPEFVSACAASGLADIKGKQKSS